MSDDRNAIDRNDGICDRNRIDDELLDGVYGGRGIVTDPALIALQKEQGAKKQPRISATRRPRNK